MNKRRNFVFLLSISLLLPALLEGCAQAIETYPHEVPTSSSTEQAVSFVEYSDTELGFSISLPATWEGFSIQESNWEGLKSGDLGDEIVEQGPIVSLVHPKSTV